MAACHRTRAGLLLQSPQLDALIRAPDDQAIDTADATGHRQAPPPLDDTVMIKTRVPKRRCC
jgi:hypothetical protein